MVAQTDVLDQAAHDTLLVVMDHHEAKIYHLSEDAAGTTEPIIRPHDPHGFLHHLKHRDQGEERGQRAHEDSAFYGHIAEALKPARQIVVIGHGTGKSNAAHHLMAYLAKHHHEISQRVLVEEDADIAAATVPQLLAMGRKALARPL